MTLLHTLLFYKVNIFKVFTLIIFAMEITAGLIKNYKLLSKAPLISLLLCHSNKRYSLLMPLLPVIQGFFLHHINSVIYFLKIKKKTFVHAFINHKQIYIVLIWVCRLSFLYFSCNYVKFLHVAYISTRN